MSIDCSNATNTKNQVCSSVNVQEEFNSSSTTSQRPIVSEASGNHGVLNTSIHIPEIPARNIHPSSKKPSKNNYAALKIYPDIRLEGEEIRNSVATRAALFEDYGDLKENSLPIESEKSAGSNPTQKEFKVCRYYRKYAYCQFGSRCRFSHEERTYRPSSIPEPTRVEPVAAFGANPFVPKSKALKNVTEEKTSKSICRYFKRYGNCSYGEACKYLHTFTPHTERQKLEHRKTALKTIHDDQKTTKFQDEVTAGILKSNTPQFEEIGTEIDPQSLASETLPAPNNEKLSAKKRSCWYFKQYGTCKYGDRCKYQHIPQVLLQSYRQVPAFLEADQSSEVIKENKTESSATEVQENFRNNEETVEPEAQLPQEPLQTQQTQKFAFSGGMQVLLVDDLTVEDLKSLRQTEITQLQKRFPKCQVLQDDTVGSEFVVDFVPSDPDWPFEVKLLELKVFLPSEYPIEPCTVEVVDTNDRFPETLIRLLDRAIQSWIKNRHEETTAAKKVEMVFKSFLRWLDRNLEDLFIEGLKKVKKEKEAEAAGIEFVPYEKLQFTSNKESSESMRPPENQEIQTPKNPTEVRFSEEKSKAPTEASVAPSITKRGTEIVLRNLEFGENAATLTCRKITVTLQCGRCKNRNDIESPSGRDNRIFCTRCHHVQTLTFRPQLMHQFGRVMGYLDLTGCQIVDVPIMKCNFDIGCMTCSKTMPFNGLHYGQRCDNWCGHCNSKMAIFVESVKFQLLQPTTNLGGKWHSLKLEHKEKKVKDPAIQEGLPLPDNGTCKHFKKSYRWLRFPCCGKTYPCDECHNEKETDHEMKYATRMICGFCAKEQPYAREKECVLCRSNMTKKSSTHWEGGKGCRDKSKMSRDDQHKYSGTNKTVSKKVQEKKPSVKK